jgi:hypothetical protein
MIILITSPSYCRDLPRVVTAFLPGVRRLVRAQSYQFPSPATKVPLIFNTSYKSIT